MEDKNNLYILVIVGIVAVIGIVVMVMGSSNRSAYSSTTFETDEYGQATGYTCTDSDGGYNYNVKGRLVSGTTLKAEDYCNDYNTLTEYSCSGKVGSKRASYGFYVSYKCPYGCSNGACNSVNTCTETDGGYNVWNKGTLVWYANGVKMTNVDYCSGISLTEYSCVSGKSVSKVYKCSKGCSDGKCNEW